MSNHDGYSRERAWSLLNEYTQSASLLKHALAVETCVRAYGEREADAQGLASEARDSDVIHTTHDRLAALLCVRRPSVTLALQSLQVGKLIQQRRGAIALTDKHRLSRLVEAKPAARHGATAAAE